MVGRTGDSPPQLGGDMTAFLQEFAQVSSDKQLGLAKLQQLTDTMMKKGYLTTEELDFLKKATDIFAPALSPPNQALMDSFRDKLNRMMVLGGEGHRLPITGAKPDQFLTIATVLEFLKNSAETIMALSKIQLAENLYKAKLALVMKDMAEASFNATIEAGKIEALKELAQAAKSAADASLALAQIFISITMMVATQIETKRVEMRYRMEDKSLGTAPLPASIRTSITTEVDSRMRPLQNSLDGVIQALKSTAEAAMHSELAKLDVEAAVQRATSELLSKLMDIISQSASMLSKSAETDIPKTIQAILEQMTTAIQTYGKVWEQRA